MDLWLENRKANPKTLKLSRIGPKIANEQRMVTERAHTSHNKHLPNEFNPSGTAKLEWLRASVDLV